MLTTFHSLSLLLIHELTVSLLPVLQFCIKNEVGSVNTRFQVLLMSDKNFCSETCGHTNALTNTFSTLDIYFVHCLQTKALM
jgi:hypothetical protein